MKRAALSVVDTVFSPGVRRALAVAASIVLLLLISGRRPSADMGSCNATFGAGSFVGGRECQVTGSHTLSGTVTVNETLHMLANSSIVVADPSLTLNIAGGFVMEAGSIVDGGDRTCFGPDNAAFPITINATGNVDVEDRRDRPLERLLRVAPWDGCTPARSWTSTVSCIQGHGDRRTNQPPGGGPITLRADCLLTISDTGHVISEGKDPGADLVHLEACEVVVSALVESSATDNGGHSLPNNPENHCNLDPGFIRRSAAPAESAYTGCVEIWSNKVTIDDTDGHNGEVRTDGIRSDAGGPRRGGSTCCQRATSRSSRTPPGTTR